MYFTSGSDRAFEQLMQTRPGADHFDSGEAGAPEDCGTCRFYRPHWKYQFCVYEECPYQPGKLTALDGTVKFQVKGVDDEMAVFRVEKNRGYNQSENRGAQTSHGLNYQKLGKELMSQDEIATMDGGKCILQVRGVRPFFSEKYDITRHPRYKYLSDADKKNTFDVDSYLSSLRRKKRRVITEDEPFDLYDIELSDEDFAAE